MSVMRRYCGSEKVKAQHSSLKSLILPLNGAALVFAGPHSEVSGSHVSAGRARAKVGVAASVLLGTGFLVVGAFVVGPALDPNFRCKVVSPEELEAHRKNIPSLVLEPYASIEEFRRIEGHSTGRIIMNSLVWGTLPASMAFFSETSNNRQKAFVLGLASALSTFSILLLDRYRREKSIENGPQEVVDTAWWLQPTAGQESAGLQLSFQF